MWSFFPCSRRMLWSLRGEGKAEETGAGAEVCGGAVGGVGAGLGHPDHHEHAVVSTLRTILREHRAYGSIGNSCGMQGIGVGQPRTETPAKVITTRPLTGTPKTLAGLKTERSSWSAIWD